MDQHTSERRLARCSQLWDAARGFRQHATPELDKAARRNRIKANALKSAANIVYYGGTLGAGVGMYQLMNNPSPIGIVVVLVFTLTVEGLISTMLTEILDRPIARLTTAAAATTTSSISTAKGDQR